MTYRFILVLLVLLSSLKAQNYLWPTNASQYLTSAFCEFRPRHFHAAIDIKTWGRSGYKIFAIADGYIYRVRVSSAGYGKAIYLKLKDGRFVVYAHLMGFTPELEQFTDSLRFARQTNILDVRLRPDQFPVKKGQHIGYTGETGIGVPHLHFEMRDSRNRPINPLQFYKDRITDTIAPRITHLAVIPWNAASTVQFRPEAQVIPINGSGTIRLKQPLFASGTVVLAVKTFDRANGVGNRFGIYTAELFINGKRIFQAQYDRFDYSRTHLVELDKNFTLWRRGFGKFQNLFRHPLNTLQVYPDTPRGSGFLNARVLHPGENRFRIVVGDYHGNTTILTGTLIYLVPKGIEAIVQSADSSGIRVNVHSHQSLRAIHINRGNTPVLDSSRFLPYELENITQRLNRFQYNLFIPIAANPHLPALTIVPVFTPKAMGFPFQLEGSGTGDYSLLPIHGSIAYWGPPDVIHTLPRAVQRQFVHPISLSPDQVLAFFKGDIFTEISATPLQFEHFILSRLADFHLQVPGQRGIVYAPDSLMKLEFTPTSLYDSMLVTINLLDTASLPAALKPPRYPIKSRVYDLQPFDQPLNSGVWLKFRLPDSLKNQPGVDIYYLDLKKGWSFFPARADNGWLSGKITSLEKFALLQDTIPPVVERIPVGAPGYRIPPGYLAFHVEDEMAGIYRETQITVTVGNRWMIFEYDPEEKLILVPQKYLPKHGSIIRITVSDNAGNRIQKEFPF